MTTAEIADLVEGVVANQRSAVSRAITLCESTRPDHRAIARKLLVQLGTKSENTVRVGISGVPGVGKSTFIESLGSMLTEAGHRVGVLAVDPSSVRTHGSVLGDRTRMPELSNNPRAYVRPSPTAGTLGGVTRATAQAITVVEAAGHDVILVETVGVGQSEITVAGMVDTFLLLGLARSGDQLQGIKKGVLEIADVVAINKADGDHVQEAQNAAKELTAALRLVYGRQAPWLPPVLTCSGLTGGSIENVWQAALKHRAYLTPEGIAAKRATQQWQMAWALVSDELEDRLRRCAAVRAQSETLQAAVTSGQLSAVDAADRILAAFDAGEVPPVADA